MSADEILYPMKTACQLTGLSPDTLRAWERRYRAVEPKREKNGRRVYDASDIAKLRLLSQAIDLGFPISRVAPLRITELENLLRETRHGQGEQVGNGLVTRLLDAAENYRPDICDEILGLAIAGFSPREAVRLVIAPALVEAGKRWHGRHLSVAQEHLLTASVERLVMTTMLTYQKTARGPGMIFGTLAGERHAIGILLASFLAASEGMRCIYLGADLPPDELAEAAARGKASVVALSLVAAVPSIERQLDQLSRLLSPTIEVWLGGVGAGELPEAKLPDKCYQIKDFDDFVDRIRFLRAAPPL